MQWAPRTGVLRVHWASSQNGNYLVWAQLAWVSGMQVFQEIQGPVPSLSWAVNQRSGESSPSQGCQGDPSQRARVSLLTEKKQNWRSGRG